MRIKAKFVNVKYKGIEAEEIQSEIEFTAAELVQFIKALFVARFSIKQKN